MSITEATFHHEAQMQRSVVFRLTLTVLAIFLSATVADGQPKKRPKVRPPRPAQDDGSENVDGALWHIAAKNKKTGVIKEFQIRVSNFKFYLLNGKEVGYSEPTDVSQENKKAKITFLEPLPLVGEAEITRIGPGRVGGELTTLDGQVWGLRIRGIDK